jgi:hypothetical protein
MKEKANSNRKLTWQRLNCIKLIDVPVTECTCVPTHLLCTVKRSACKLPTILTGRNGYIIDSVMTLDMVTKFYEIPTGRKNYSAGNKYARNTNQFYIQDRYLYVLPSKQNSMIEIVQMFGMFEDVVIPQSFKDCSCQDDVVDDCSSPLDMTFPIDGDMIEALIALTVEECVGFMLRMQQDKSNNSQDNNQQVSTEDNDQV